MAIAILPSSTIFGTNFSVRIEIPMRIVSNRACQSPQQQIAGSGQSGFPAATRSAARLGGANASGKSLHQYGRGGQILCRCRRENAASDLMKQGDRTMPREHYLEPFYLIITDQDNGTFSVEGPMTDDRLWNHAVVVAQKSGRQVRCSTASGSSAEDTARNWLQRYSGKQVPPGEIVHL